MSPIRSSELAALIATREPACGATTVVAIDGPSGAGKTDLAEALALETGGHVLHLDDVYPGWHGLAATPPMIATDVLAPTAVGGTGLAPRWSWVRDAPLPPRALPPTRLLILDGVGSGSAVIRPFLSLLVWVEAPADVRRRRGLARDGGSYEPWWDVWAAQESRLFTAEQTRAHADVILDTGA